MFTETQEVSLLLDTDSELNVISQSLAVAMNAISIFDAKLLNLK